MLHLPQRNRQPSAFPELAGFLRGSVQGGLRYFLPLRDAELLMESPDVMDR